MSNQENSFLGFLIDVILLKFKLVFNWPLFCMLFLLLNLLLKFYQWCCFSYLLWVRTLRSIDCCLSLWLVLLVSLKVWIIRIRFYSMLIYKATFFSSGSFFHCWSLLGAFSHFGLLFAWRNYLTYEELKFTIFKFDRLSWSWALVVFGKNWNAKFGVKCLLLNFLIWDDLHLLDLFIQRFNLIV